MNGLREGNCQRRCLAVIQVREARDRSRRAVIPIDAADPGEIGVQSRSGRARWSGRARASAWPGWT